MTEEKKLLALAKLKEPNVTTGQVAKTLGVDRATLYRSIGARDAR